MKYIIIEILFGWTSTPIIHLNLLQMFTGIAEFLVLCWIIDKILKKFDK